MNDKSIVSRERGEELHIAHLNLEPNEASGLLALEHPALLKDNDWHMGFWTVLDEARLENCIGLIGRRAGHEEPSAGWEARRLDCSLKGSTGSNKDCEAIARHAGWIYVFGSAFGLKTGPLQSNRQFVARFREDAVNTVNGIPHVQLHVVENEFLLHRLINDALRDSQVSILPNGPEMAKHLIRKTRKKAIKKHEPWYWRIQYNDVPINIEGVCFRLNGAALIGLRVPTTADGHPIIVEIEALERMFEGRAEELKVAGIWVLETIGSQQELMGLRDLHPDGDSIHVLAGNLDSTGGGSVVLKDYPEGQTACSTHWKARLPRNRHGGRVKATLVRKFSELHRVEGLAADAQGRFFYVSDEDGKVLTRFAEVGAV